MCTASVIPAGAQLRQDRRTKVAGGASWASTQSASFVANAVTRLAEPLTPRETTVRGEGAGNYRLPKW